MGTFIEERSSHTALDQEVYVYSDASIDGIGSSWFTHTFTWSPQVDWFCFGSSSSLPSALDHRKCTNAVVVVSSGALEEGCPAEEVQTQTTVSLHELESCCQGNGLYTVSILCSTRFGHLNELKQN